ncbi:MAG TPA: hypothetical protein G4N98_05680 [Thermoflexia bacterium]|nr:hypothetical protein [Thermoflexia bacterium]
MVDSTTAKQGLFRPGKADWLCKEGVQNLDSGQKALLLALVQLEAELGQELAPEESQALASLGEQLPGTGAEQLRQAMRQLVQSPPDPKRKTTWPELKSD